MEILLCRGENTATHFDCRRGDEERFLSAQRINSKLDLEEPAILLGDLNDVIGSRTLGLLDSFWKRVNDEPKTMSRSRRAL